MGLYGLRKPGVHNTGPVVSEQGFRTGKRGNTTEVIDKDGLIPPAVLAASLEQNDVMLGGTIDVTGSGTETLIDAGDENYKVIIMVRVTTTIENVGDIEFGYVGDTDAFGKLTVTAEDATQTFTGDSADGANVIITHDGTPTAGEITYVMFAEEL